MFYSCWRAKGQDMLCETEPGGLGGCFHPLPGSGDDGSGSYSGSGTLKNQLEIWSAAVMFYSSSDKVELVEAESSSPLRARRFCQSLKGPELQMLGGFSHEELLV